MARVRDFIFGDMVRWHVSGISYLVTWYMVVGITRHFDVQLVLINVFFVRVHMACFWGGGGRTKVPFVNFSVSKMFNLAKVPFRFFESHSYSTGVTAHELRRHLWNMVFNDVEYLTCVWQCRKIRKIMEQRKLFWPWSDKISVIGE